MNTIQMNWMALLRMTVLDMFQKLIAVTVLVSQQKVTFFKLLIQKQVSYQAHPH